MSPPKRPVRTSFPVNRLAELVRATGGKTRDQAIADAQQYVESMRPRGLEGIEAAIAALEAIVGRSREQILSPMQMQEILSYTDRMVMLATTFGFARLDQVAHSLGELAVGLSRTGGGSVESIAVHVRAARLFAPNAAAVSDDNATKIFMELRRVLKRFLRSSPVPANESYRQSVLKRLNVLDTPPEEQFDRLTKLASQHFKAPIALISLVDQDRQWFMSRCGLDAAQIDRDIAFCAHAIMSDEPLVVLDATKDPRFANNPLVLNDPNVRFYAGAPLISAEGVRLGTFCIIDQRPRKEFCQADGVTLQNFATRAMDMIYARVFHWLATQQPKQQIQSVREAGKKGSAAMRQFLDTVDNEIREPLSAILNLSQIMGSSDNLRNDIDYYKDHAQAISTSAQILIRTLNAVMKSRQAQNGELVLKDEALDLAALIAQCVLPYRVQAAADQIAIEIGEVNMD